MEQSQFENANQERLEFVGQTKVDENLQYEMKYRIVDPSNSLRTHSCLQVSSNDPRIKSC